jgi:hypothetical protein
MVQLPALLSTLAASSGGKTSEAVIVWSQLRLARRANDPAARTTKN